MAIRGNSWTFAKMIFRKNPFLRYGDTFFVVQGYGPRSTDVRASHTRLSCQTYLCQLSKDSASAVKRLFVSCQKLT